MGDATLPAEWSAALRRSLKPRPPVKQATCSPPCQIQCTAFHGPIQAPTRRSRITFRCVHAAKMTKVLVIDHVLACAALLNRGRIPAGSCTALYPYSGCNSPKPGNACVLRLYCDARRIPGIRRHHHRPEGQGAHTREGCGRPKCPVFVRHSRPIAGSGMPGSGGMTQVVQRPRAQWCTCAAMKESPPRVSASAVRSTASSLSMKFCVR